MENFLEIIPCEFEVRHVPEGSGEFNSNLFMKRKWTCSHFCTRKETRNPYHLHVEILFQSYLFGNALWCPPKGQRGVRSTWMAHLSSMAFLTRPFFRFAKVAWRDRSSLMRAILIFFRPISAFSPPVPCTASR